MFRRTFMKRTSELVKNSGSTARDHLANERTFLAWARTGMGFVGLGVGIDSVQRMNSSFANAAAISAEEKLENEVEVHAPALVCVATGALLLLMSTRRYYAVQDALTRGEFLINRKGIATAVMTSSVFTLSALSLLFAEDGGKETVKKLFGKKSASAPAASNATLPTTNPTPTTTKPDKE